MRLELAGPAGVGKSTLARALADRCGGEVGSIWGQPVRPLLASGLLQLPELWKLCRYSRSLLWDESRHVVRLRTLHWALTRAERASDTVLIFDEGPVFALAWLRASGHPVMRSETTTAWWQAAFRDWARAVDLVVLLDAPDQELATRIRTRPDAHEVKLASDAEIAAWMARFRGAFDWVLDQMAAENGPRVLRFRSDLESPLQVANRVQLELERISNAA